MGEVINIMGALICVSQFHSCRRRLSGLIFITDGFLTAALAMEPKEKDLCKENLSYQEMDCGRFYGATDVDDTSNGTRTLYLFSQYFEADLAKWNHRSYDHGSLSMVQRMELQIRKQINFSNESIF